MAQIINAAIIRNAAARKGAGSMKKHRPDAETQCGKSRYR
jgi:hypothetical protein